MMTTNIFEMITMKTWWAPAKSNWGDGEVGDAEEQVGGGEGGQQAVEHRPHLPGGVYIKINISMAVVVFIKISISMVVVVVTKISITNLFKIIFNQQNISPV